MVRVRTEKDERGLVSIEIECDSDIQMPTFEELYQFCMENIAEQDDVDDLFLEAHIDLLVAERGKDEQGNSHM